MNRYQFTKQDKKRKYLTTELPVIKELNSDIYIITKVGDRLDTLANKYYKDSTLWWIIARANPDYISGDSFFLEPATRIRIPVNHIEIIQQMRGL
jgi:hypothetical protein